MFFFLGLHPRQSLVNVSLQFQKHPQTFFVEVLPALLPSDEFPRLSWFGGGGEGGHKVFLCHSRGGLPHFFRGWVTGNWSLKNHSPSPVLYDLSLRPFSLVTHCQCCSPFPFLLFFPCILFITTHTLNIVFVSNVPTESIIKQKGFQLIHNINFTNTM